MRKRVRFESGKGGCELFGIRCRHFDSAKPENGINCGKDDPDGDRTSPSICTRIREPAPGQLERSMPAIEFAYNDSVNPRTFPYTPFFIAHGRETWTPIKATVKHHFGGKRGEGTRDGTTELRRYVERKREAEEVTRDNHRRLTSKFLRDQREKFSYATPFSVGTRVWLTDVRLKGEQKPPVLESRRLGPLLVTEALPHDS